MWPDESGARRNICYKEREISKSVQIYRETLPLEENGGAGNMICANYLDLFFICYGRGEGNFQQQLEFFW